MSVSTDPTRCQADYGQRPRSALVNVTQIHSSTVNPKPIRRCVPNIEFGDYLSADALKKFCKTDDLTKVTVLEIKVDIRNILSTNFGSLLPNLRQLKFVDSFIPNLKFLNTELKHLEVLWMPRCSTSCIDGVKNMKNICELYLAFNEISDLSPCVSLESIEVLDLEGNMLQDVDNITHLKSCSKLKSLNLEGNPVVNSFGSIKKYRRFVCKELCQLAMLDDFPVKNLNPSKLADCDVTKLNNEWGHINKLLRELGLITEQPYHTGQNAEAYKREKPRIDKMCASHLKVHVSSRYSIRGSRSVSAVIGCKNGNRSHFVASGIQRAQEAGLCRSNASTPVEAENEDSSEAEEIVSPLTTGDVVCGGIGSALRRRREWVRTSKPGSPASRQEVEGVESVSFTDGKQFEDKRKTTVTDPSESSKPKPSRLKECPQLEREIETPDTVKLLDEEDALQAECAAVLQELASWRRENSMELVQETESYETQNLNDCHHNVDNDVLLISTDSESTIEDGSSGDRQKGQTADSFVSSIGSNSPDARGGTDAEYFTNSPDLEDIITGKDDGDSTDAVPIIKRTPYSRSANTSCKNNATLHLNGFRTHSVQKANKWMQPIANQTLTNCNWSKARILPNDMLPGQTPLSRARIMRPSLLRHSTVPQPLRLIPSGVSESRSQSTNNRHASNCSGNKSWSTYGSQKISPSLKPSRNDSAMACENVQYTGTRSAQLRTRLDPTL